MKPFPNLQPSIITHGRLLLALLVLPLAGLAGCGAPINDDEPCDETMAEIEICATLHEGPTDGYGLVAPDDDEALPLEALFDENGCTTISLEPGTYEWAARDASGSCLSSYESVELAACEDTLRVSVALDMFCQDGR